MVGLPSTALAFLWPTERRIPLSGGNALGAERWISGNNGPGVEFENNATSNLVAGNYIGTNVLGSAAVPNNYGVRLNGRSSSNTIGGYRSRGPKRNLGQHRQRCRDRK